MEATVRSYGELQRIVECYEERYKKPWSTMENCEERYEELTNSGCSLPGSRSEARLDSSRFAEILMDFQRIERLLSEALLAITCPYQLTIALIQLPSGCERAFPRE